MKNILTARLALRPMSTADVDIAHALWTDPAVRRYLWDDLVISRERADEVVRAIATRFERDGRGMWLVAERGADAPCGFCGFLPSEDPDRAELIYGLLPGVWGRGYATESAAAVIKYAFETLRVPRIVAAADVPNAASVRVMERLGMRVTRDDAAYGGRLVCYEIENRSARAALATE